jgi:hypothetical protein
VALVVISILVGMAVESIHQITTWITFALYGGYVAPNVLKWHWWRFNGHGYFAGMISGVAAAILLQTPATINKIWDTQLWEFPGTYAFFVTAPISLLASIIVCLLTRPESDEVLDQFYRDVQPWGFWGPVARRVRQTDSQMQPNREFGWDALNVAIGIIWQLQLMVVPAALVVREWPTFWVSLAILIVTSVIMKFTWYDRLGRFLQT